jgi:Fe2+ or Zn2+ uptake regulation protein
MGYNARNDEIRDNVTRMRREWEAQRGSLATVRRFNATLSAKGYVWFWPKIAAALTSKHHWLIINCDSCGTVIDLDLRVKPRDAEVSIRVALRDVQCPRCNGHGRPRIIALAQHTSI